MSGNWRDHQRIGGNFRCGYGVGYLGDALAGMSF